MPDQPTNHTGPHRGEPAPHVRRIPGSAHRTWRMAAGRASERAARWWVAHFAEALLLVAVVAGLLAAASGVIMETDLAAVFRTARGGGGG